MASGVYANEATIIHKAIDVMRACAEGPASGPLASQIEARRQTMLFTSLREVVLLIRATREAADEHCRLLTRLVTEIIARGIRPGDPRLRDLLLPIAGRFADLLDVPEHFQSVLRGLGRHQTKDPRRSKPTRSARKPTLEVATAAKLLAGRSIVVVGGERNPTAERKLKEAFSLTSLHWIETREHQSLRGIESTIGRAEVAVVVLLIKLSSHSFGPQLQTHCRRNGTPLVRLKAGYSPSQVAKQILKQCGERLHAKRVAEH